MVSEVNQAIDSAVAMGMGQVMSLVDALDAAVSEGGALDKGWSTGLFDLDLILGGLRRSEWTVVSGDTGAGKTVTQMGLGTNLVKNGVGVMLACLELHPHEVAIRWASQILGESVHKMDPVAKKDAPGRLKRLGADAFIVPKKGFVGLDELGGMLEYCVRRHGVGVVSIDHLDYIIRDVDDLRLINKAVMGFDDLVTRFHVHGILGAHPNKTESVDKKGSPRRIRMGDIRGSAKIKQLAYNIVIVDPEDPKTRKKVIRVEKRRWTGNTVAIPARMTCKFSESSLGLVNDTPDIKGVDYKMFAAGDN
jgi:KaiC/GvpD/RAD55 family RecA-like ATPase